MQQRWQIYLNPPYTLNLMHVHVFQKWDFFSTPESTQIVI